MFKIECNVYEYLCIMNTSRGHRGDCTEIAPVSVVPASEKILVHQRCNPKILMQALYETGESERMICRWGALAGDGYKYQHGAKMEPMGGA